MMAMEPAGWWTSEDVEVERGRISKIRARLYLRNRLLYKSISGPEGRRRTVRPGSGPPKSAPDHPPRPRTPPFHHSNPCFARGCARPTGLWTHCPRPSWPFVGTSKRIPLAAPRRRPLWSSLAARRSRCLVTFIGDTVEQVLVGRVDGCAARSMRVCMPEVGAEQLNPWA